MAALDGKITFSTCEMRPCWVDGRRAMFHRWTDSARPVKPKGMEDEDTLDRYQLHSVHGLVEYEDGTMARVWPNTIQFADGGYFDDYDWEAMEHRRETRADGTTETAETVQEKAVPTGEANCVTCAHGQDNLECEQVNWNCYRCTNLDCACKKCHGYSNYEPRGAEHGDNQS